MKKQYQVFAKTESGLILNEGMFPTQDDAENYCNYLAETYGPIAKQDFNIGERIVEISYRPLWTL